MKIQNTRVVLVISLIFLSGCVPAMHKMGLTKCAPVYGNYCGENYPLAGYEPTPVDSWDQACQAHDRCYGDGYKSKTYCDREFLDELEYLSQDRLIPQRMLNAHSYFRKDGRIEGWVQFIHEGWSLTASCEGGDGARAQFYCVQNNYDRCWLDSDSGPGRAGLPCNCLGYPLNSGIIFEE
ncbi:MAG: hypothetical protein OXF20_15860 [Gammaproteobacteria bacterium]|nr:hypothetical protein [Gammaproteobacteria bacterium]